MRTAARATGGLRAPAGLRSRARGDRGSSSAHATSIAGSRSCRAASRRRSGCSPSRARATTRSRSPGESRAPPSGPGSCAPRSRRKALLVARRHFSTRAGWMTRPHRLTGAGSRVEGIALFDEFLCDLNTRYTHSSWGRSLRSTSSSWCSGVIQTLPSTSRLGLPHGATTQSTERPATVDLPGPGQSPSRERLRPK